MNEVIKEYSIRSLVLQRNFCLGLIVCLLALLFSQAYLLITKSERVIVVPSTLEKEIWIEGKNVSPSYLEQMGCFIADLLLTRSATTYEHQLTVLLRHTDPRFAPLLISKLDEELTKLKKDNASYTFFREQALTDPYNQTVTIKGERSLILGDKILTKQHETYQLGFSNTDGHLRLVSIKRDEK